MIAMGRATNKQNDSYLSVVNVAKSKNEPLAVRIGSTRAAEARREDQIEVDRDWIYLECGRQMIAMDRTCQWNSSMSLCEWFPLDWNKSLLIVKHEPKRSNKKIGTRPSIDHVSHCLESVRRFHHAKHRFSIVLKSINEIGIYSNNRWILLDISSSMSVVYFVSRRRARFCLGSLV